MSRMGGVSHLAKRMQWSRFKVFVRKAETLWNRNRAVAVSLVCGGMGLSLWIFVNPQSPGVSIGMLALVAGIMAIRSEMHILEKSAWIVILIFLAVFEVQSIHRADEESKNSRHAQLQQFHDVAEKLESSIELSKTEYEGTIGHVNEVLGAATQASSNASQASSNASLAASKASESLATMTGGDSWGWVQMMQFIDQPNSFFFSLVNTSEK
jgi:hypothetical protein